MEQNRGWWRPFCVYNPMIQGPSISGPFGDICADDSTSEAIWPIG